MPRTYKCLHLIVFPGWKERRFSRQYDWVCPCGFRHLSMTCVCYLVAKWMHTVWVDECVLPGYREHTRAGQCFQKRSERSCPLRRTAGAPDAAHVRDDKPDDTQTHKTLHRCDCFRFVSICSLHRTEIMLMSKTIAAASLFHAHTPRSHFLMFSLYEMRKSRTVCLCLVLSMSLFFPP